MPLDAADLDALMGKARHHFAQVRHYRARADNVLNPMRRYDGEECEFHAGHLQAALDRIGEHVSTGLPAWGATDAQIAELLGVEVAA